MQDRDQTTDISGRYRQTVPPTSEPVTLDEARQQCSLQGNNSWDELLAGYISDARRVIERRHERQLLPATWTLSLDIFPDEIELRKTPVVTVSSITYVDQTGTMQTFDPAKYQVDIASPNQSARIRPVWGVIFPISRTGYMNAVVVTFTAGYAAATDTTDAMKRAAVPSTYRRAILMFVKHMFEQRGMDSDSTKSENRAFEWLLQTEDPGATV